VHGLLWNLLLCCRSRVVHRQADDETCVAGFGFDVDGAAEFLSDDAMNDFESEAGTGAFGLGGEEGFENVGQNFSWDSGPVIAD
jgi:hypothetical protein